MSSAKKQNKNQAQQTNLNFSEGIRNTDVSVYYISLFIVLDWFVINLFVWFASANITKVEISTIATNRWHRAVLGIDSERQKDSLEIQCQRGRALSITNP